MRGALYLSGGPGALDGSPGDPGVPGRVLRGPRAATFRHPKIVKRNSPDASEDRKKMEGVPRGVATRNSRQPTPTFSLCPRTLVADGGRARAGGRVHSLSATDNGIVQRVGSGGGGKSECEGGGGGW